MAVKTLPPTRVRIEHECFIPILKQRIRDKFLEEIARDRPAESGRFADFLRLIEAIYHFEYHSLIESIKEDYALFQPDADPGVFAGMTPAEIEEREERFLDNFLRVMERGNFNPLTQEDIDLAEEESYLFTLPIVIDWDKLDDEVLTRYFSRHGYGKDGDPAPDFARRILIFRRGIGIDSVEGLFLGEKVEMLLRAIFKDVWYRIVGLATRRSKKQVEADRRSRIHSRVQGGGDKSHLHKTRYIERITLKNTLVDLAHLFKKTRIQEPTFERLVLLYRPTVPKKKRSKDPDAPKERRIFIKTFRDIPMADLEVVFPEKKLSMNVVDRIKVGVTGLMGVGIVGFKVLAVAAFKPALLIPILGGLFGYGGKTFKGYKRSKDRYQSIVTESLYHKSLVSDQGVLFYLIDSLEAQEYKEASIAYYFLWRYGDMTEDELDSSAETFLKNAFGLEVDFEVDDALDKLLKEGLVEKVGERFRAAPLEEALRLLDHKWDNYFKYNED